ncbi:MAG TPA: thiamine-phosphate kinase [Candidatus Dormibacteraeota bacterium]|nr:thiamine-phosphate kinase [Candidatus Dormibacteraeota bacterium]
MSSTGETALLRQLMELARDSTNQAEMGPGDDSAGWRAPPGGLVLWSTDSLCEDVDFRRQHQTPYQVGWKAWMTAVSDLSAMGARPIGGLVAALLPAETSTEAVLAIQLGLVEAAEVDGATIMGGDLSRSAGPLALTVTVLGEVTDGSPVTLGGGVVGDRILVTGALGMAGAAVERLEEGGDSVPGEWLERLLMPPSRSRAGMALRRAGSSAMTDLSDGLLLDLDRICQASGVGADLWLDQVPRGPGLGDAERGVELALTGGEDFELLATIPETLVGALLGNWQDGLPRLSVVGILTARLGTQLFWESGGDPVEAPAVAGFRHF